jgi:hypothetical protein
MCLVVANSKTEVYRKLSTKVATDAEERTGRDGWVPPDIDAVRPPVAKEATCDLGCVISQTGMRVEKFVDNLNRLTAITDRPVYGDEGEQISNNGPESPTPSKAGYIGADHLPPSLTACNSAADHTFPKGRDVFVNDRHPAG